MVHDATWVAVLTLLILQASFLAPPFGYAVLMVRNSVRRGLSLSRPGARAAPYLAAQLFVLALVLAWPSLIWQRNPTALAPTTRPAAPRGVSHEEARRLIEQQLPPPPDEDAGQGRQGMR